MAPNPINLKGLVIYMAPNPINLWGLATAGNRRMNLRGWFLEAITSFSRFPAELGPETRSDGSGSKNGAQRTQN